MQHQFSIARALARLEFSTKTDPPYCAIAYTRDEGAKKTFQTMNGLRGLAALIVVIWHSGSNFGMLCPPGSYLAVDLFFVLSGFVLAHSYEDRFAGGMTIKQFFIVRLIRLYPLYFLGTVIIPLLVAIGVLLKAFPHITDAHLSVLAVTLYSLTFSSLMLPTPDLQHIHALLYPLNVPAWSLFMEIIVNMIYVATWRSWSNKNIIITMIIAGALFLSKDWFFTDPNLGWSWATMPFGLVRVFYSFPAGVLIYRIFEKNSFPLPHLHSLFIIVVFPLLLFSTADWASKVVVLMGCPLLVAFAAKSEPAGIVARICALLGSASYAVYAVHYPLITLLVSTLHTLWPAANPQFVGYAFLVAIVPTSLLIDKFFDEPARRIATHFFIPRPFAESRRELEAKHMNLDDRRADKAPHSSPVKITHAYSERPI